MYLLAKSKIYVATVTTNQGGSLYFKATRVTVIHPSYLVALVHVTALHIKNSITMWKVWPTETQYAMTILPGCLLLPE